jgi:hypothetical protein
LEFGFQEEVGDGVGFFFEGVEGEFNEGLFELFLHLEDCF